MAIRLSGPACFAVSQGVVYAVVDGYQDEDHSEQLRALVKSEYPTTSLENNIWFTIGTTPSNHFSWDTYTYYSGSLTDAVCNVDRNGAFTLRYQSGPGYRYDPMTPKIPHARTCNSAGNGLGEWIRTDLVDPKEAKKWQKLFVQTENIASINTDDGGHSGGDEIVIYYSSQEGRPAIHYARLDKRAYVNKITSNDLTHISLSEKNATIENLEYGDGQMYSVLGIAAPIPVPGTDRVANKTLTYFPFESPFDLTSSPASVTTIPWEVKCNWSSVFVLTLAAKNKFYYICSV
ncbi:hypothetical protein BG000_009007 [Podila horticola]|nr:hypothetical protein BG000_009007 [Podila horticola]